MDLQGRRVYLIGIGGVGVSAIAQLLLEKGAQVSGSDSRESRMTHVLRNQGIQVWIGHDRNHLSPDIDLAVYSAAIPADNPELVQLREWGIPLIDRPRMLQMLAAPLKSIGVSGTHGKTSTTSMVAQIFLDAGMDPSLAVGGFLPRIGGTGYMGAGEWMIYEACEAYDSMLQLYPDMVLVTNIDADHLDYYGSLEAVKDSFRKYFMENIPEQGQLIYFRDDKHLREVVDSAQLHRALAVGFSEEGLDYRIHGVQVEAFGSCFCLSRVEAGVETETHTFRVSVPGLHNVSNAALAAVAALEAGIPAEVVGCALAQFANADRRFQLKLDTSELLVVDDYAHHPAEVEATLLAARSVAEQRHAQLVAIFQPHLYSRTAVFQHEFSEVLALADVIILTSIYGAREENADNVSVEPMLQDLVVRKDAASVVFVPDLEKVTAVAEGFCTEATVLVTLGAGDVWKVADALCWVGPSYC